jgi:DNA-binding Lrp family transcriptional regulator
MNEAFVFFCTPDGSNPPEIKQVPGVVEIFHLRSAYDGVAKVRANSMEELRKVCQDIRRIDSIKSTLTLTAISSIDGNKEMKT